MPVPQINSFSFSARRATSAALLLVGLIAMLRWMVWPHVGYLQAVQRLEPVVEEMAGANDRIRRMLGPRLRERRALQRELDGIRAGLFTPAGGPAFLHDLPSWVERAGCTLLAAHFTTEGGAARDGAPDPPDALTACRANVTVAGRHEQIIALLAGLQNHRPRVWVDACRLEASPPRSERLKCELAMTIYVGTEAEQQPEVNSLSGDRIAE